MPLYLPPLHTTDLTALRSWAGAHTGFCLNAATNTSCELTVSFALLAQVEYMKSLGFFDKKHNRRRDEFVSYVEAHAKMNAKSGPK